MLLLLKSVFPPKLSSSKQRSLSITFPTKPRGPLSLPRVPHALPAWPHLIRSLFIIWRGVQIMELLIMTLASSRSTLLSNTLCRCLNVIKPCFNTHTLTILKVTFFNKHHTQSKKTIVYSSVNSTTCFRLISNHQADQEYNSIYPVIRNWDNFLQFICYVE